MTTTRMTTTKKVKIVIAGGGFAGLSAAMSVDKRLARRPDIDVTLYMMKLPRLTKKLRVLASWTLDLLFGAEIEQPATLRAVEAVTRWPDRARDERRVAWASPHTMAWRVR